MLTILTNDDGIDAPGLAALSQALPAHPAITLTVAPRDPQSECSHRVTTQHPLNVAELEPRRYAVAGTPADCARVALLHLLPALGHTPDPARLRVLSGINAGGNLGADIYISGTVAAVREAAFFGIPGVAFSQYLRGPRNGPAAIDWARAARWAARVLDALDRRNQWNPGTFWNVNFPSPDPASSSPEPEIVFCPRSRHPLPVKYQHGPDGLAYVKGLYHSRAREPGSDIDVCFGGHIAVTLIEL